MGGALEKTVCLFYLSVENAVETHRQVNALIRVAKPDQPQVRNDERALVPIVALGVLDLVDRVHDLLALARLKLRNWDVETDLPILPDEFSDLRLVTYRHF